jgi:hypothetical protein
MQHIGKNRARLREIGEGLNQANCLTLTIDMIPEAKKLLIWNTYLEMELERKTKISCDVRWNRR